MMETLKLFYLIILFIGLGLNAFAQSPYAMFGDNSELLEAKKVFSPNIYCIDIQDNNGKSLYVELDLNLGVATLIDSEGNIILRDSISNNAKAMLTTIDPHAENYYNLSPYTFCGANPINAIDPDGRDWYQNNETLYYTWFDGDIAREGYTHIGGIGSLLGEFEPRINNILKDVYKDDGLYSEGRTVDITDPNKGAIIPSDFSKMDDFLDEFVLGYGPEISILTENHPYTRALETDARVVQSQEAIRRGETKIPGQITGVSKSWWPWDVFSTLSIAKQFVGSYSFDSYTSNDNKHLLNIIYDTKSFRSLFYHIPGTGFLNHSRKNNKKSFSTTYQFYIWRSKK